VDLVDFDDCDEKERCFSSVLEEHDVDFRGYGDLDPRSCG
jgi:hypothetical protein